MSLLDIMKQNDIDPNWVFTHARFHDKEGLFFFESVVTDAENDKEAEHYFDTKCILVDDSKFNYGDDMEKEVEINVVEGKVIFSRIDGAEVSIPKADFSEMPFKLVEFGTSMSKHNKPADFVEID